MKIIITCTEPKIQASLYRFENGQGLHLTVCFYSGQRYQHDAQCVSRDDGRLLINIFDNEQEEYKGSVEFVGETEEEKEFFGPDYDIWVDRNKETQYFLLINKTLTLVDRKTFQYESTFGTGVA